MQRRERVLVAVVGLLVGGWLVDSALVGPGLAWLRQVREQTATYAREAAEAQVLIDRQSRIVQDWRGRHAAGLLEDEDGARFRVQQALAASARASGFAIDSVGGGQRVPASSEQVYDLLRLTVSGQGSLAQCQDFLAGLEGTALPLRIERCELAARDARKDQLDAAVTISTRIVSPAALNGRGVPEGTAPWQPDARDPRLDAAVLAARPFLADRRGTRAASGRGEGAPGGAGVAAPVVAGRGWALVGIVARDDGGERQAFLRHLEDGSERIIALGEEIAGGLIVAVEDDGLHLLVGRDELRIPVGFDLSGQAVAPSRAPLVSSSAAGAGAVATPAGAPGIARPGPAGQSVAGAPAAPAAGAASPFQVPVVAPDPERDAILQRLRQQRNRSP